jgi:hypothetical protein
VTRPVRARLAGAAVELAPVRSKLAVAPARLVPRRPAARARPMGRACGTWDTESRADCRAVSRRRRSSGNRLSPGTAATEPPGRRLTDDASSGISHANLGCSRLGGVSFGHWAYREPRRTASRRSRRQAWSRSTSQRTFRRLGRTSRLTRAVRPLFAVALWRSVGRCSPLQSGRERR